MGSSQSRDFDTSKLNSFWTVIGLSHDPIDTFVEMWYHVFLWSLFSSIIIHMLASGIAFGSLRKHKTLRFGSILVLISGVVTPLTAYSITSAAVAGAHRAASFQMYPLYAMFWGCGQTLVTLILSFTRVLATL
ncbi:transmembrane protein 170A-like [Oppia nitens]|uniref:transmembrane protein 170A-like n=1 Tax=Oppia nitens TaxID=1686743 RepID=UPI0023DB1F56|nr:transmembrane protein 170A-like [Oppia nitens]